MSDPSDILAILGVLVVIAAGLGVTWSVLIANKNRTDIASLHASNDELRQTVTYERTEREREQATCAERIAKLDAKIEVLQGEVVQALVGEFSTALRSALQEVLIRSEPTAQHPTAIGVVNVDQRDTTQSDPGH